MKHLLILIFLLSGLNVIAQNHSDLWHKVEEIKRTVYPDSYNNPILITGKYGKKNNQPLVTLDDEFLCKNEEDCLKLDIYTLSQIAGIGYLPANDINVASTHGMVAISGVINIYTKTYTNQNPSIRRKFKISFEGTNGGGSGTSPAEKTNK